MKKTKLLTSLAALGLVISLGACDTTEECEECPVCPEVTEPETGDEDDEAWATTPGELLNMARDAKNYTVTLEADVITGTNAMSYASYNRLFTVYYGLIGYYDPDEYDETSRSYTSLWDDETNDWVTREVEDDKWTSGEERYAELHAEYDELYAQYEAMYEDYEVTDSSAVDIFVDEDYMLMITYEWEDVADYETNPDAEADLEYVATAVDLIINNEDGGCTEYDYGQHGNKFTGYTTGWEVSTGSTTWNNNAWSLFDADPFDFNNFFDYYGSGSSFTAWTYTDSVLDWGFDAYLDYYMLGASNLSLHSGYSWSYYYYYLTYFYEAYQEMLTDYYLSLLMYVDRTVNDDVVIYEEDVYVDLYDVGATDATKTIEGVIAAYNDSLVVEPEEDNDSSSSSED